MTIDGSNRSKESIINENIKNGINEYKGVEQIEKDNGEEKNGIVDTNSEVNNKEDDAKSFGRMTMRIILTMLQLRATIKLRSK